MLLLPLVPSSTWRSTLAHLSRLQHLITKQQIRRNPRRACDSIPQHAEIVVHAHLHGVHGITELEVQTGDVAFGVFVLKCGDYRKWLAEWIGREQERERAYGSLVCRGRSSQLEFWE